MFSHKFDPAVDIPDLTGKVAIVTGGNSGIGFATIQHLSRKGCKVYLAARNESKATDALTRLDEQGRGPGNGEVIWLKLDLSDLKGVQAAAQKFLTKETRLDILINNAAMVLGDVGYDDTGIQDQMRVNHFGPFVFTQILLPLMKQTAQDSGSDVRILNLSSDAYQFVPKSIRFRSKEDLNVTYEDRYFSKLTRYGASKLTAILYTMELQRRLDEENVPIICIAVHPGFVSTEGKYTSYNPIRFGSFFIKMTNLLATPASEGAHNSIFAAASPEVREQPQKYKGSYMAPVGKLPAPAPGAKTKVSRSHELAKELWATTEKLLAEADVTA